jgi:hypothetical protein
MVSVPFLSILTSFTLAVAAIAAEYYTVEGREERGLAKLLGGKEEARAFLEEVWGGDEPYLFRGSSSGQLSSNRNPLDLLWSLGLSEHYVRQNPNPWVYRTGTIYTLRECNRSINHTACSRLTILVVL